MTHTKIALASDNWAPAHPLIVKAIVDANIGYAQAYGGDLWTEEATQLIQKEFNANCKVFILPSGTGSNVLALTLSCLRHESVLCSDIAHINYQESGAAEAIVGCKLLPIVNVQGKIQSEALLKKIKTEKAFGKHSSSPRVLSIAQPTELGTVYTLDELKELSAICKAENLLFHMDGSRIYNAAISLNCSLQDIAQAANLDLLSLGGTKNGLMGVEALLIFNESLYQGSDHLQKQTLQLMSKMRFLSAQYIPFFKENLWKKLATDAHQKAEEIASIIKSIPKLSLSYPVQTNQIFFKAPNSWVPLIQEKIACLTWDHETNELRMIASWCTSNKEVSDVRTHLNNIAKSSSS